MDFKDVVFALQGLIQAGQLDPTRQERAVDSMLAVLLACSARGLWRTSVEHQMVEACLRLEELSMVATLRPRLDSNQALHMTKRIAGSVPSPKNPRQKHEKLTLKNSSFCVQI